MRQKAGKKYKKMQEKVPESQVDIKEAIETLKGFDGPKFDETVDVAINLGIDAKSGEQNVRGSVSLPHGTGKDVRVLVFAQGEKAQQAQEAGADFVGDEDLIEKIKGGWLEFDKVIATPDQMSKVTKIARILGPRGLMPNPKLGTVTPEPAVAVKSQKKGAVEYRTDKAGNLHAMIGKKSFTTEALCENYEALFQAVIRSKPASVKGEYVNSISVSTTMSPSIRVRRVY